MTRAITSSSRATSLLSQRPQSTFCIPRPLSRRHDVLAFKPSFTLQSQRSLYSTDKQFPGKDVTKPHATLKDKETELYGDGINPPTTTIPPPLNLPEKTSTTATPVYWFRIGRAYGKFYIAGVKQTYANFKKARGLRAQIQTSNAAPENDSYPPRRWLGLVPPPLLLGVEVYMRRGEGLSRSQLQLLVREREDVKKLPLFAVLVALFGEWLPLIVPFIPGRVPRTCRIPKQARGMREAVEEMRRESFRRGIVAPDTETGSLAVLKAKITRARQVEEEVRKAGKNGNAGDVLEAELEEDEANDVVAIKVQPASWLAVEMTEALDRAQLAHVSSNLGLHGKLMNRLLNGGESSLTAILKIRVAKRLHYLNLDDELLMKERTNDYHNLSLPELEIACAERGIDVNNRTEEALRKDLGKWLDGRSKDKGYGAEVLNMLFKRPNVW